MSMDYSDPGPDLRNYRPQSTEDAIATAKKIADEVVRRFNAGEAMTEASPVYDMLGQLTGYEERKTPLGQLVDNYDALQRFLPEEESNRISANVAAQISESRRQHDETLAFNRERALAEDKQFEESLAQQKVRDEETKRQNNINATLDLLEADIRRGELGASEATNRFRAATEAANIQRGILQDQGGKALPAGTQFFPGLEPSGAIADIARGLGIPFGGFATQGTFGVNPSALAATIPAALGPSVMPGVDQSVLNAASALAQLGAPVPATPGGRAQRPPENSVTNAAKALAGVI